MFFFKKAIPKINSQFIFRKNFEVTSFPPLLLVSNGELHNCDQCDDVKMRVPVYEPIKWKKWTHFFLDRAR